MQEFRRGSKVDKPLGQYEWMPTSEYKSSYEHVMPDLQFKFALDLHHFLKHSGYSWPEVQKEPTMRFMPYSAQKDFAIEWWKEHFPRFKLMGLVNQEHFIHDALIDGTVIYGLYARRFWDCPKYQLFEAFAVQKISNRSN